MFFRYRYLPIFSKEIKGGAMTKDNIEDGRTLDTQSKKPERWFKRWVRQVIRI